MTTIAYKDGLIAVDSRQTRGDTIVSDHCMKCTEVKGVKFFLTGSVCDEDALIGAYFGASPVAPIECSGYVLDAGILMLVGCDNKTGIWKQKIDLDTPDAIGSGAPYALTAMDMGATAEKAVAMAAKRDVYTGGEIRVFRVES